MNIRKLKKMDAPLMLEWMHDETVVRNMQTDFASKTLEDCIAFIEDNNTGGVHMAITNNKDEYMGTVSLKNIRDKTAEFGIVVRGAAMGKGYSKYGMEKMIKYGFSELGLNSIYWCVDPDNGRALRFYDKERFMKVSGKEILEFWGGIRDSYTESQIQSFIWYLKTRDTQATR